MPKYQYNPHQHVKIWLSNKQDVFMNLENQMRLVSMRETNPEDVIHLVYDSSLLSAKACTDLSDFCNEHNITPVDAAKFNFAQGSRELNLHAHYQNEIRNLDNGGNLAVASDIIRWLSPVYTLGTYTDFDVPVDTSALPDKIEVDAPVLLNIGSLQTRGKEIILSNNDYIAIVDSDKANSEIEAVQTYLINTLNKYRNDFIDATKASFNRDSFIDRVLVDFMSNRSESIYISRSQDTNLFGNTTRTSLELRKYIKEIMSDTASFLAFKKATQDTDNETLIQQLKTELKSQLTLVKWIFFRKEYNDISNILKQGDDEFLKYVMMQERSLYLKSIVVCTTGPIAIAKALFNGYVFSMQEFSQNVQKYSFNTYGLKRAFQSKNSIPMGENFIGMMNFLGAEEGVLNDSSWLESGQALQNQRGHTLSEQKEIFKKELPGMLEQSKSDITAHIRKLEQDKNGFWAWLFGNEKRKAKIEALNQVLSSFSEDCFDTNTFKTGLCSIRTNSKQVFSGLFSSRTKSLIDKLTATAYTAVGFSLTKNRKVSLRSINHDSRSPTECDTKGETCVVYPPVLSPRPCSLQNQIERQGYSPLQPAYRGIKPNAC